MAGVSDEKVSQAVRELLAEEFAIHLGVKAELAEAKGGIEMRWGSGSVVVDKVVAAVGRRANVNGLGLETLGVPLDDNGLPEVDPQTMRVSHTPVLLAGDANGAKPLLHEGADEGHIAGLNATSGEPIPSSPPHAHEHRVLRPRNCYGRTTNERGRSGIDLVGEVDFGTQGRARTMQENRGLIRLYAARSGGRLLGAEMAAPTAEHLAHLLALAIGQELTVHELLRMPFYHPTFEEGLRTALLGHRPRGYRRRGVSDLAGCGSLCRSAHRAGCPVVSACSLTPAVIATRCAPTRSP